MSYQALARKYRPQTFEDIVGQQTAVRTLHNAIEQNRIHHAYLFSGVRGVGKTTLARVLAKALNCSGGPTPEPDNSCTMCREITEGIDLDVREIDAATYTGVDNVRELRDASQFQPARDRYRIFIIDEAHMLSTASWNALLKLIEEPPPHVVFMFATTEMHKVPQTILSRVQKLILRKITLEDLIARLALICEKEGIAAEHGALEIVARRGEGSVRDSLSLLDQIIAFSGRSVTAADVATVLGLSESTFFSRVLSLIGNGDHTALLEALQEAADTGRDFKMLYRDLLAFVRNLLLISGGANESLLAVAPEDLPAIRATAGQFSYTDLLRIANLLLRDDETVNRAEHQRLAVEIALLKAATFPRLRSVEDVLASGPGGVTSSRPAPSPLAERSPSPRTTAPTSPARNAEPAAPVSRATSTAPPASSAPSGSFTDAVRRRKPRIAAFLETASVVREADRLVITFEDSFELKNCELARESVQEAAVEAFGQPLALELRLAAPPEPQARRAEDRPSPLQDDPVVRSLQKHLGGEIIDNRNR